MTTEELWDKSLARIEERVVDDRLVACVETPGTLLPNKGINIPDTTLSIPAVTARDRPRPKRRPKKAPIVATSEPTRARER